MRCNKGVCFLARAEESKNKIAEFRKFAKEEGVLLIKLSGKLLNEERISEVAQMHKAGKNIVLVHGCAMQIDQRVRSELGREPEFDGATGLRITDEETLRIVIEVTNEINQQLVEIFSKLGIPAQGFSLESDVFRGQVENEKIGRYGRIIHTNAVGVMEAVLTRKLPIIAPLARDAEGPLNLNADDAVVAMAAALGLQEIFLMSDVDGIYIRGKRLSKICGFCS